MSPGRLENIKFLETTVGVTAGVLLALFLTLRYQYGVALLGVTFCQLSFLFCIFSIGFHAFHHSSKELKEHQLSKIFGIWGDMIFFLSVLMLILAIVLGRFNSIEDAWNRKEENYERKRIVENAIDKNYPTTFKRNSGIYSEIHR